MVIDFVMRRAVDPSLGVQVKQGTRFGRHPSVFVTDTGFADDIALCSGLQEKLQELTDRVVGEAGGVGLAVNVLKTEQMSIVPSSHGAPGSGTTRIYEQSVKRCDDFKFLGCWVRSSRQDFLVRRALAWKACLRLKPLWMSPLPPPTKRRLFRSLVHPILVYGAETWTLTEALSKALDGTYTRLLRTCMGVHYSELRTNKSLYGDLPQLSVVLKQRRLQFAGHCSRAKQPVADVLLWHPHGQRPPSLPKLTFSDQLRKDTGGLEADELYKAMGNRV